MDTQINEYLKNRQQQSQPKKRKKTMSFGVLGEEKIFEQIYRNGESLFMIYDSLTDTLSTREAVKINDENIYPLNGDIIDKQVIKLPTSASSYSTTSLLLKEIQNHIYKYVDLDPIYLKLASYYVLLTWVYDKNTVVPYLGIYGDYGTGKTRAAQTIGNICYKPIVASGSITIAPIYRLIEICKGTLIINEFDFDHSDMGSEMIKVLNNGYEVNMATVRMRGDKSGEFDIFDAFSPKIFTYRKTKKDDAFQSRLITLVMKETKRKDIPIILPPSVNNEATTLRNKLLMFRFKNYFNPVNLDLNFFEGLDRRMQQTIYPLMTVIKDPEFINEIKNFLKETQQQVIIDRSNSYYSDYAQSLIDLINEGTVHITPKDLAAKYNEDKIEKEKINDKKAGQIIRNELRLKLQRLTSGDKKGRSVINIIPEEIDELCKKYGIETPNTILTTLPNLSQVQVQSEDSEHSEDKLGNILTPNLLSGQMTPDQLKDIFN